MSRPRVSSSEDFLALLTRRKWFILVPFFVVVPLAVLLAKLLPGIYVSETLILVQPRDVPADFVRDLISGSTEQRLSAIEQQVLSRSNLVKILDQFGENLTELRGLNMDRKVKRLHDRIHVTFEAPQKAGTRLPVTYFRISFSNQDPSLAQKIAERIAALFIELDSRTRETQVYGTADFMESELQKVEVQLQESTTRLRELKERYKYELPEQLETNLRTLDRLSLQKKSNAESAERYVTMKLTLERQLSQTPPAIAAESIPRAAVAPGPANPLVDELRKKERSYNDLVARYTTRHPDVERLKAELDRLRKEIPPQDLVQPGVSAASSKTTVMVPNPVYQSLVAQLAEVKGEIAIRDKEKSWLDREMAVYSFRVQSTPKSEQDVAAVVRNNNELMKRYQELKERVSEAKMSESLESRQKGAQFQIVDHANFPLMPSKPNRWAILFGGLALGLALGIALAFGVDYLNQKVWTQSDIENLLGVPVLVEIPEIITPADAVAGRQKARLQAAGLAVVAVVYLGAVYLLYLYSSLVLRGLDPFVQWLMG